MTQHDALHAAAPRQLPKGNDAQKLFCLRDERSETVNQTLAEGGNVRFVSQTVELAIEQHAFASTGDISFGEVTTNVAFNVALCHECRAVGIKRVRVVDPYNLKECETAVKEELAVDEASVIISRRPCVLLKYVKTAPALRVTDACRGCKSCMKLGCPSISMVGKKARIDATLCVGCEVCSQLCAFDAIQK